MHRKRSNSNVWLAVIYDERNERIVGLAVQCSRGTVEEGGGIDAPYIRSHSEDCLLKGHALVRLRSHK